MVAAAVPLGIVGCGATKIVTVTSTVQQISTVTGAEHVPTRVVTRTITVAAKTSTTATASNLQRLYTFSGNGSETVGTITIPAGGATIAWRCDGSFFAFQSTASSTGNPIEITSQASSGESVIYPGSYNMEVNAVGNWKIVIVA